MIKQTILRDSNADFCHLPSVRDIRLRLNAKHREKELCFTIYSALQNVWQ